MFYQIGEEAISCRTKAAVFDLSYYSKLYIGGPDARDALNWICTANLDKPFNSLVFSSFDIFFNTLRISLMILTFTL